MSGPSGRPARTIRAHGHRSGIPDVVGMAVGKRTAPTLHPHVKDLVRCSYRRIDDRGCARPGRTSTNPFAASRQRNNVNACPPWTRRFATTTCLVSEATNALRGFLALGLGIEDRSTERSVPQAIRPCRHGRGVSRFVRRRPSSAGRHRRRAGDLDAVQVGRHATLFPTVLDLAQRCAPSVQCRCQQDASASRMASPSHEFADLSIRGSSFATRVEKNLVARKRPTAHRLPCGRRGNSSTVHQLAVGARYDQSRRKVGPHRRSNSRFASDKA